MKKAGKIILLTMLLALLAGVSVSAKMPNVTSNNTIRCYPFGTNKRIELYDNNRLEGEVRSVPYAGCDVTALTDKAAYLVLMDQDTMEMAEGWVSLDTIFYDSKYKQEAMYSNMILTLYKGPSINSTPYVGLNPGVNGIQVGKKGNWLQMLFCSEGQYYMGWIQEETIRGGVFPFMENTGQVLANGIYTITPRNNAKKRLTYNPSKKTLKVAKASSSNTQRFKITYKNNGYYKVVPVADSSVELRCSGKKADGVFKVKGKSVGETWKISRSGAYFYVYQKSTKARLGIKGNKVYAISGKKTKDMKWKFTKKKTTPKLSNVTVFSQFDPKWADTTYMNGAVRKTISSSGCGLLALTNVIYALNGEFISPAKLAKFSLERGHYFYNQGTADTLYADVASKWGKKYHFKHLGKYYKWSSVKKHLNKKRMVIANVPGHYIAIVAYRKSDHSYLVLDSSINGSRNTDSGGNWISESELSRGALQCYYFHVFDRR